jgi:hypothetical protein
MCLFPAKGQVGEELGQKLPLAAMLNAAIQT